jgi:hypothetical protein
VTPGRQYIDGVPAREEVTAGMEVARELRERYRVSGVLVSAAQAGYIAELRCGMEYCLQRRKTASSHSGFRIAPGCQHTNTSH